MIVEAITLETADREKYKAEIEAIAHYLIEKQLTDGPWNYGDSRTPPGGDTSITQYGVLGLWAAARAGVSIPVEASDAGWCPSRVRGCRKFFFQFRPFCPNQPVDCEQ